jgi:hypothetical protein
VVFGGEEEKGEGFVNDRRSLKVKETYRFLPLETFLKDNPGYSSFRGVIRCFNSGQRSRTELAETSDFIKNHLILNNIRASYRKGVLLIRCVRVWRLVAKSPLNRTSQP